MTTNKFQFRQVGGAIAGMALVAGTLGTLTAPAQAAATIVIMNTNAAGVGFNDATPAAPVGGNTGTTLGQQRLIAFQRAADIWGATLTSTVPVRIGASFQPLSCTANSAVLGSAGADEIWRDFPNAPRAITWYPSALASKLAGAPQQPQTLTRRDGARGVRLGEKTLVYDVVTRGEDGKLSSQCVHGEAAAKDAVQHPANAEHKEHNHEAR